MITNSKSNKQHDPTHESMPKHERCGFRNRNIRCRDFLVRPQEFGERERERERETERERGRQRKRPRVSETREPRHGVLNEGIRYGLKRMGVGYTDETHRERDT